MPASRSTRRSRRSNDGGMIVLHPEGTVTRDPDGWPMAGKTGAARLALLAPDIPVIPVAQWGVQDQIDLYRKKVRLIPRPRHVLSVGDPIDLSEFYGRPPDAATLRAVTEVIMRRLRTDVAELRGEPAPDRRAVPLGQTSAISEGPRGASGRGVNWGTDVRQGARRRRQRRHAVGPPRRDRRRRSTHDHANPDYLPGIHCRASLRATHDAGARARRCRAGRHRRPVPVAAREPGRLGASCCRPTRFWSA